MKINEKNMCYFATSPPIDREGWLQKRGDVNKSWQRRYFVLKGNLLFYFEKKGDREPIGVIILEGCTVELAEEGEHYCFQIIFHGINNRTYYLSAETQETMEQWMRALTCAGYEYMKLMVAELQRQLTEIERSKDKADNSIESAPQPPPRRQNPRQNPFNRPAPPPPVYAGPTENSKASNGGGLNSLSSQLSNVPSSKLTASNSNFSQKSTKEFNFQTIHEAFGKEIEQDLKERRRLKELAQRPLIDL